MPNQQVLPIGMRGTSYEMVAHLLEHGVLTGYTNESKRRGGTYIYFWPIRENWKINGMTPPLPFNECEWDPYEWARQFAKGHAERDFFSSNFGFKVGEYEGWLNPYAAREKVRKGMSEHNLTAPEVATLIDEAKLRKGYVIHFHPQLAQDFKMESDMWFGETSVCTAIQVHCPNGIPSRYVTRILPIDERDRYLLDSFVRNKPLHRML